MKLVINAYLFYKQNTKQITSKRIYHFNFGSTSDQDSLNQQYNIINSQLYKIKYKMMLPPHNMVKVKHKMRNAVTQPVQQLMPEVQQNYFNSRQFNASPSVFLERLKMGKDLQGIYLKYRRMKKNNYIKHLSSNNKYLSGRIQKGSVKYLDKSKNNPSLNSFDLNIKCSSQPDINKIEPPQSKRLIKFSQQSYQKTQEKIEKLKKKQRKILQKPSFKKIDIDTEFIQKQQDNIRISLEGVKAPNLIKYQIKQKQSSRLLNAYHKIKKFQIQSKNTFKIQAWKQDNILDIQKTYFEPILLQD